MSTEQELAEVTRAITNATERWYAEPVGMETLNQAIARAAIAAVNTIRTEQARAGDERENFNLLMNYASALIRWIQGSETKADRKDAIDTLADRRAAVLAWMNRPETDDSLRLVVSEDAPDGEIHVVQNGKTIGKITGVGNG